MARMLFTGKPGVAGLPVKSGRHSRLVALLTPYDGGNLGDSAIQQAVLANLRICDPNIQTCGITLDPARTSALHQIPCYPLARGSRTHYPRMQKRTNTLGSGQPSFVVKAVAGLYRRLRGLLDETLHVMRSQLLLRKIDALVIAGGGQLDDEWGGSWGHPYALMKWAVLARTTGTRVVFLSVGACRVESSLTRFFLKAALSLACYRSYRDEGSRRLALEITPNADGPVVPDLAFSLPNVLSEGGTPHEGVPLRVGVSPIAYCHPELWPTKDAFQYQRYITELASFISAILQSGASVRLFSSCPPDDQTFMDICDRLYPTIDSAARARLSISPVNNLRDLFGVLRAVDTVVGSRLHGLLLSFLSGKPALAVSYDRKVKCLMDDLGQTAYCLDIRSFKSDDLLRLFAALRTNRDTVVPAVAATCRGYERVLQQQYSDIKRFLAGRSPDLPDSRVHDFCDTRP